ncbi:MAG: DUF4194 domain-containing protein [Spirochaetales bacterium]|nr:DUF4194 domain-containing protein [Spirochaetales bacterium]
MNEELTGLSDILEMGENDLAMLKRAARALVSRTYLLRGVESEELAYDFAARNWSALEAWFRVMGAELRKDESLGVIAWRGWGETRARLGREETALLLALRVLYEERRSDLSLAAFPQASVFDVVERYRSMTERELAKTRLVEGLRRFSAFKLIKAPTDPADPDAQVVLYPSLALALDQEGIDEVSALVKPAAPTRGEPSGNGDDGGDERETDTEDGE